MVKEPEKSNHPVIAFVIGAFFIALILIVLAGVIHHLTVSPHGPGLLKPLLSRYQEQQKSELLDQARRLEEAEIHRHFHNPAEALPKLPENLRPTCFICHSDFPHSKNKRIRSLMNIHTQFFVCETCHIKKHPDMTVVYKWHNPLEENSQGPFYGTSYLPDTNYLSTGKDYLAKITPFFKSKETGQLIPAIQIQDTPMAKDYMKVRDKLSPEMREGIKNKFHEKIRPQGHECYKCHTENGILPFQELDFTDNRIANLIQLDIVGMLQRYNEFYLPELFADPSQYNQTSPPGRQDHSFR